MWTRIITGTTFICVSLLLQGCATNRTTPPENNHHAPVYDVMATDIDPRLDHFIAWIPRDRAQTAGVARALTHIALGNAKQQVGTDDCDGGWVLNDRDAGSAGPYQAVAPRSLGGYPAWYYRISHHPGLRGCTATGSGHLYRKLAANLPGWIIIRRASLDRPAGPGYGAPMSLLE